MMTRVLWRIAGVGVLVVVLFALRAGSAAEVRNPAGNDAWVRLSWSARPERVEVCRRRTDEELAVVPEHMRLRFECNGVFARYLLQMSVDDSVILSDTVRGGGLRHDRSMHVLHEAAVRPGRVRVQIRLARIDTVTVATDDEGEIGATAVDREAREQSERARQAGEAVPAELMLDEWHVLGAGQVLLVTYDRTVRALVVRTGEG